METLLSLNEDSKPDDRQAKILAELEQAEREYLRDNVPDEILVSAADIHKIRRACIKECIKEIEKIYNFEEIRLSKRSANDQTLIGNRDTVILSDIKNTLKKLI